jgi:hypothetical protein
MDIQSNNITEVIVKKGFPGEIVEMKDGIEYEMIIDLNSSTNIGPTKFATKFTIFIYHSNGEIDTIRTNGKLHEFKGWYESDVNLIEKYSRK